MGKDLEDQNGPPTGGQEQNHVWKSKEIRGYTCNKRIVDTNHVACDSTRGFKEGRSSITASMSGLGDEHNIKRNADFDASVDPEETSVRGGTSVSRYDGVKVNIVRNGKILNRKKRIKRCSVSFAPAPKEVAEKYDTIDGHPNHEGRIAQQKRRIKKPETEDLTASAIKIIEDELGDVCKPSIIRLKRRAGLLPLRNKSSLLSLLDSIEKRRKLFESNKRNEILNLTDAGSHEVGQSLERCKPAINFGSEPKTKSGSLGLSGLHRCSLVSRDLIDNRSDNCRQLDIGCEKKDAFSNRTKNYMRLGSLNGGLGNLSTQGSIGLRSNLFRNSGVKAKTQVLSSLNSETCKKEDKDKKSTKRK